MVSSGAEIIALSLKQLGVKHVFGLVGIPVVEIAEALIAHGIQFVAFRNEQSAAYAASICGYIKGRPGVLLVVGGPGVVHALPGVENSRSNRFPLLVLAGSAETSHRGMGAFQQLDQISLVKAAGVKFAEQPDDIDSIGRILEQAYRTAFYGQAGATYVDFPANIIQAVPDSSFVFKGISEPKAAPRSQGDPDQIKETVELLKNAKFPLLIVGKGVAYAKAEETVRQLQSKTKLAFIPTPMGKGVISDHSPENLSAARSLALKEADVVLILGARLNWILHYGGSGKFNKEAKFIQVDNVGEDIRGEGLGVLGDLELVSQQLITALDSWTSPAIPESIVSKRATNESRALATETAVSDVLKYQTVYKAIRDTLAEVVPKSKRVVYVCEGANTMDISRTSFPLVEARTRLDAGTNATMGIGMGYAIAAKVAEPESLVIGIEGDSAFGFSAMEIETAVRTNLPMVIFVINNSGIYHGTEPSNDESALPPTALGREIPYHQLAQSLGAWGAESRTLESVIENTKKAIELNKVCVINVIIELGKARKIDFGWMASTKKQ